MIFVESGMALGLDASLGRTQITKRPDFITYRPVTLLFKTTQATLEMLMTFNRVHSLKSSLTEMPYHLQMKTASKTSLQST